MVSITSYNLGGNIMVDAGLITVKDGRAIAETVNRVRAIPGREGHVSRFGSVISQGASQVAVTILNDNSAELPAFSILRVGREVTSTIRGGAASSEDNYGNLNTYVWTATAPDEGLTGQYAILQTRTPVGQRGEAILTGVTKVRLDDTDEGDYANPQEDDIELMKTGASGKFPVLVVDTAASADTWGYILLNSSGSSIAHFHFQADEDEYLTGKRCDPDGSYPDDDPTGAGVEIEKIYHSPDFRLSQHDTLTTIPTVYKVLAVNPVIVDIPAFWSDESIPVR